MRILLLALIILSYLNGAGQNLELLEPKKIWKKSEDSFLLVRNPKKDHQIIRNLANGFLIVRNTIVEFPEDHSEYFEINNQWKWVERDVDKKSNKFYVLTEQSLKNIENIIEIQFDAQRKIALIETEFHTVNSQILELPYVTAVQSANRTPKEESVIRNHNLGINAIRKLQKEYPDNAAIGYSTSIKENAFSENDIDILLRGFLDETSSTFITAHATDMATLIGGSGSSSIAGKGVALKSKMYSEDFENLLPATDSYFTSRDISVQNHSYGVGIENFYGIESEAFDEQAFTNPTLLHVFSSGNQGLENSTGNYADINQYRTLTGSFKQAKNVLVVTGTDEFGAIPELHSAGPAYDGRIKPELSAFGKGGTSDASAIVSGACLLLQEAYENKYSTLPTIETLKSILIASSEDIEDVGPDFKSGYGQLNVRRAMDVIDNDWIILSELTNTNPTRQFDLSIPENTRSIQVVLSWRDPAANSGDEKALINDLDLRISKDGTNWKPWTLDHRPSLAQLTKPATTGDDTLNTAEMITINLPESGVYSINATSKELVDTRPFSIAYYLTEKDSFKWLYPNNIDPLLKDAEVLFYFENSFDEPGIVSIDFLEGNWTEIGSIAQGDRYLSYTPGQSGEAVLKANFGAYEVKSDTFAIHSKLELEVALLCDDRLVLNWNRDSGANFEVLSFEESVAALAPVASPSDTFAIIDRNLYPGLLFTARPTFTHANGQIDETVRVDRRGAGCYLNNFLVSVEQNGSVSLELDLSLPQEITSLKIMKEDQENKGAFIDITPDQDFYSFIDDQLVPGKTTYQVMITAISGIEVTSEVIEIFTTDDRQYILFPNPVQNGQLSFLSPVTSAIFEVLDSQGKPLTDFIISAEFEVFELDLPTGSYLYRVLKEGKQVKGGRFVVR